MEAFLSFIPYYVHSGIKVVAQVEGPKAKGRVQLAPLTTSVSPFPLDKREVEKATWSLPVLCHG